MQLLEINIRNNHLVIGIAFSLSNAYPIKREYEWLYDPRKNALQCHTWAD